MKRKLIFLSFVFLLLASLSFSQTTKIKITGKITDSKNGQALIGATVQEKGTSNANLTDVNGVYTLTNVQSDGILIISYLGYQIQEVNVNGQQEINIVMDETTTQLEDVVVVGYGTQRKRDVTGSIVSIKGEEFASKPVINPINALQGSAAGVIVTNSGEAGKAPNIRIRGVGSISNTNPLYVVDGVFTDNIDYVNTNDIASMEILKDPSSLAMFGVQGANGVIIITTKRAKNGETNINLNSYYGYQQVMDKIDVANADQFKMLYNEQQKNLNKPEFDFSNYTGNTDWQDQIFRQAMITNNSLEISSASESNQSSISLNYFKQEGVVKYDMKERFTAHLHDDLKVFEHLKIGGDVNMSRWNGTPGTGILGALWATPVVSPKDPSGVWNSMPDFQKAQVANPIATAEINKGKNIQNGYRIVTSGYAELNFLKDFTWRSAFYADLGFDQERIYSPKYYIGLDSAIQNAITAVNQKKSNKTTWQSDQTLSWTKAIGKLSMSLLAGMTAQYKNNDTLGGSRQGLSTDIPDDPIFWYLNIGAPNINEHNSGIAEEQSFISYLFRGNFSYNDRYMLNMSFRRDGTSKFSPTNKWGNFPSIGGGVVLSEFDFWKAVNVLNAFNFFKIKASWGRLGNDKIGNYLYYPVLNTGVSAVFGDNVYQAAVPAYSPDPNIHWEVMEGTDAGVEAALFSGRVRLESDYYYRKTNDILVALETPGAAGVGTKLTNAGTILNSGIELTLTYRDKIGDNWGYSLSGNFTTIHNEVLSIGDNVGYNIINGPSITTVSQPIGEFYGYEQVGIFQNQEEINKYAVYKLSGKPKPGDIKYRDINNDSIIDDKDRTYIGSPTPKYTYGFSVGISFKNIELSMDMQGVTGNYIYRQWATATFASLNYASNRLDRWTGEGTSNTEPILDNGRPNNFLNSSYWLDKGDYFRIRNIALAYKFNGKFFTDKHIKGGKIYVNAQNLKTFTKAKGYSPEVGGSPVSFGVDNGTYPVPAIYTVGLNLNF